MRIAITSTVFCALLTLPSACAKKPIDGGFEHVVDDQPVRELCDIDQTPVMGPDGWPDCSRLTEGDAKRLAANRLLILETRRASGG